MKYPWFLPALTLATGLISTTSFAASTDAYQSARAKITPVSLSNTQSISRQFKSHAGEYIEVEGTVSGIVAGRTPGFLLKADKRHTYVISLAQDDTDIAVGRKIRALARIPKSGVKLEGIAVTRPDVTYPSSAQAAPSVTTTVKTAHENTVDAPTATTQDNQATVKSDTTTPNDQLVTESKKLDDQPSTATVVAAKQDDQSSATAANDVKQDEQQTAVADGVQPNQQTAPTEAAKQNGTASSTSPDTAQAGDNTQQPTKAVTKKTKRTRTKVKKASKTVTAQKPAKKAGNVQQVSSFDEQVSMYAKKIRQFSRGISNDTAWKISYAVLKKSAQYDIDPRLVFALIAQESRFNSRAVSPVGAQGLGQLMPGTAAHLGVDNAFDINQNVDGTVKYLASLLQKYNGNTTYALAAYNAGPGNVSRYGGVPPFSETQNYIRRINLNLDKLPTYSL
ncbi:MAG TPA: transglycosylase SLT domain-containing protein [Armatimonadota bacterium]|nr:transglycosylase SLT domain-containing protein [Armatimonadota bacterium]